MSLISFIIFTVAVIASTNASGIGLLKTAPIVRYAPFYNFPTGVRSIHAVAPVAVGHALPPPPALLPAPLAAPAPVVPAPPPPPVFPPPAPAFAPAPVFPAPAPVFPAPAPVFPAPAPVFSAPAPVFPAPAPVLPAPAFAPAPAPFFTPYYPRVSPVLPAPPVFARTAVPFSPIVRPAVAAAPVFAPQTVFAPAPAVPITRFLPNLHVFNKVISTAPAPFLPAAPLVKQFAWK